MKAPLKDLVPGQRGVLVEVIDGETREVPLNPLRA
jgi:hypothetical protein